MTALPAPPFPEGPHALRAEHLRADRGARPFLGLIDRHPSAVATLLAVLNRPEVERQLTLRSFREPALAAAVNEIEAEPRIVAALDHPADGRRFHQLVGVAVKLKMIEMGWVQCHRPQSMARYSERFKTAETYEPLVEGLPRGHPLRVLDVLERLEQTGTAEEQERDRADIRAALAATRAEQGRPF